MLALTGCGAQMGNRAVSVLPNAPASSPSQINDTELQVVATTSIFGDLVRNVAGEEVTVRLLIPVGADPHHYQPSAQQVSDLQSADLVIVNGLGLEAGLADVMEGARADGANIFELAELLNPLPYGWTYKTSENNAGYSGHSNHDPHVWLDPARMADATRLVAKELAAIDGSVEWMVRAEAYAAELLLVDKEIQETLSVIPESNRKLVTNHDALGYFAARYRFELIGTVVPGGSTLAEPSSAQLAALVETIRSEGVRAIFAETTEPTVLAEAVAREVGRPIEVVSLFTGSLGDSGSGADTLIRMLRTNAERIAAALA